MEKDMNANQAVGGETVQTFVDHNVAPLENNTAITPTTIDQIEDPEKVVNINQDKLKNVDDKKIVEACEKMQEIDDSRSNLNDKASEIRSELKALGIPTAAFNAAYARFNMGDKKRAEMDAAFAKCAKAMGAGYQTGLWD